MLEYLSYYSGGYFGPNECLIIKKCDDGFSLDYTKYYHRYTDDGFPYRHTKWSPKRFSHWNDRIDSIRFDSWENEYWIDACDGEQWTLLYKYEGKDNRYITGSNAYPDNWDQLQKLIVDITRSLPQGEFISAKEMGRIFIKQLS